jgi:hypothetical protein
MEGLKRQRWCLYLPGICLHNVPAIPGSDDLHLHPENPLRPRTFDYFLYKDYKGPPIRQDLSAFDSSPLPHEETKPPNSLQWLP